MATKLGFRRFLAAILAATGLAAGDTLMAGGNWMPLLPDQDFYDFQLFAPPDLQEYSIYHEPHEGIFFSYDRLYWGITPPGVTDVGTTPGGYLIPSQPISPQAIVQLNNASLQASAQNPDLPPNIIGGLYIFGADPLQLDLNTGWLRTAMTWGNRYEGGWIYDDRGMAFGYFDTGDQVQSFTTMSEFAASSPTQIFTQVTTAGASGGGGAVTQNFPLTTTTITANSPPPDHLISQKLTQQYSTRIQSGAASFIIRRALGRRGSGSTVRFSLGPRFLQFEDRFHIGYESNQYAFNQGPTGGTSGQGVNVNTPGAANPSSTAQQGQAQGQSTGAAGGAGVSSLGGTPNTGVFQSASAGDVLAIGGADTLTGQGPGSPLQTGAWATDVFNNMVGPEIALLMESDVGRWTFLTELKFTAGLNWQNNLYRGSNFPNSIGADYLRATFNPSTTNSSSGGGSSQGNTVTLQPPPLFLQIYGVGQNNATNDVEHNFVFTPIGEWRFGGRFKVSQAVTLHAGYTGMVLGNIARASSNTAYKSVEKPTTYAEVRDPSRHAASRPGSP
ncbi:MAG: hypothetical protein ACKOCX_07470 [Planctomycetota bacterium]